MQAFWGSYGLGVNAVLVGVQRRTTFDAGGNPLSRADTAQVQGWLVPAAAAVTAAQMQADLTAQRAALEAALSVPRQEFRLVQDDGNAALRLAPGLALKGPNVTAGPDYPGQAGAEYVAFQTFSFTVEAEYPAPNAGPGGGILVSFDETLSFDGGGPELGWCQPVDAPPVRQQLLSATPYRATQGGTAVSLRGYPTPPAPLFPGDLDRPKANPVKSRFTRGGPRGLEFVITWAYQFSSARPLDGSPNAIPTAG